MRGITTKQNAVTLTGSSILLLIALPLFINGVTRLAFPGWYMEVDQPQTDDRNETERQSPKTSSVRSWGLVYTWSGLIFSVGAMWLLRRRRDGDSLTNGGTLKEVALVFGGCLVSVIASVWIFGFATQHKIDEPTEIEGSMGKVSMIEDDKNLSLRK